MPTASPAPSPVRLLPGAGIVVALATTLYWLLRQDHLYIDGAVALGFLSQEGDVPSYWGYFFLARRFVGLVAPLGLTPHEAGCLFSGVMAGLSAGLAYVALGVLGVRTRKAALLTTLVVLAPCQIYYATTLEKRTVTEFGAALVLLAAVLCRRHASWWAYAAFLLVVTAAVHVHYNVAAASVPAFVWLGLGPADQQPFRPRAAAGGVVVAAASLLLVPSLFLPFAAHSHFLTYFGRELAATPLLLHAEYLLHLAVDLTASLGIFLVFAWMARRDARLKWVLAGCLPMVLVHLYGMELNDRHQVPFPDIPGARGAYLITLLPVLACLGALVLERSRRSWTGVVAAALVFNALVLGLWFADRGESWPGTIREVRAILRRYPRSPVPPTVLVRSRDHTIVASATTPAAETFAAVSILDQVAGLEGAARNAAASEWNRGCRELLAAGATVLVCPGVLADLERAGARSFVDALLDGIALRPVPDTPEGYAVLALR